MHERAASNHGHPAPTIPPMTTTRQWKGGGAKGGADNAPEGNGVPLGEVEREKREGKADGGEPWSTPLQARMTRATTPQKPRLGFLAL